MDPEGAADPPLQPGDRVQVTVFREEELSGPFEINSGGELIFPLVGEVQAAGLDLDELRLKLTAKLTKYLVEPQVRISRAESGGSSISLLGLAGSPGTYNYTPGLTLMRLISQGGGFAESANKRKIKIIRVIQGKRNVIIVNGLNIMNGEEDDVDVKPGDIVFVPESIF